MDVSVIIPTFNGLQSLKQFFPSVVKAIRKIPKYEIIIVDNGSTDKTAQWVESHKELIYYIQLQHNTGFTGACNEGARQANGKYLLFLNNDCELKPSTIEKMYYFLEENKKYIATQPVIYTKKETVEQVGYVVDLTIGKAYPVTDTQFFESDEAVMYPIGKSKIDFTDNYVYGLSGTCLLLRRTIFEKTGKFDETFHSYLEDVDLFIRLALQGCKYYPTLNASCTHAHMATSKKMGSYKEQHDLTNWIRIIAKSYPTAYLVKHFPRILFERLRNGSGLLKRVFNT